MKNCPLRARTEPTEATYQRSTTKVKVLNAEGVAGLETEMATMSTLEAREGPGERIGPRITVEVEVGLPVTAVVDTGSPVSIISSLCLTKAVLFVQCEAPQELLIGTDLQAALGIELKLKEKPEPTLDLEKSDEASVRLLHTTKVPARHEGMVPVSVSGSVHVPREGIFEPDEREKDKELRVERVPALMTVHEGKPAAVQVMNVGTSP